MHNIDTIQKGKTTQAYNLLDKILNELDCTNFTLGEIKEHINSQNFNSQNFLDDKKIRGYGQSNLNTLEEMEIILNNGDGSYSINQNSRFIAEIEMHNYFSEMDIDE
ncbi:hypothetical protein HN415_01680, partial [Candidatus Woesearchaeota archaeon]|nr:hypothetical protein [Candidatus Woesearchaeota archaeon]